MKAPHERPIAVLCSCKTLDQLEVARRYVDLWRKKNPEDLRNMFVWARAFVRMRRLIREEQKRI